MNKIILIALTFCVVIFTGCQTGSGENPKEVLKHFFDAVAKRDFTTAKKYATNDSEGMLSMMQMGMQNMKNEHAERMMNFIQNIDMEDGVISGDSATVAVKDKNSGESSIFLLKKEKGNWKVAFDMSTLMGTANKKMKEHGMRGTDSMDGVIDSAEFQKGTRNPQAQKYIDSIRAEELKKSK